MVGFAIVCHETMQVAVYKIQKLRKERQANVKKIKTLIHSTKDLMQTNDNVSIVQSQLDNLMKLFDDVRQNEWFIRFISKRNIGFDDDAETFPCLDITGND